MVATNAAKNHLPMKSRRISLASEAQTEASFDASHDCSDPQHEMTTEQLAEVITTTVENLPVEVRNAINMREKDGLTYEEISAEIGCPIATVRSRISRARRAFNDQRLPLISDKDLASRSSGSSTTAA